ncbi:MAG TPA: hypothetical protein VEZ90_12635 [Blastocatellia bacterium]|nr:hypothetical protein [Blastocatellia bacterium]
MAFIKQPSKYFPMFAGLLILIAATPGFAQKMQTQQYPQPQESPQQEPQAKPHQKGAGPSQDEVDAAKKVEQGTDAEARLKAATDFAKKYPKSTLMKQVATLVASKIDEVKDGSQKITFAQTYKGIFKGPDETAIIEPVLLDGFIKANRLDEAFQQGAADMQHDPNNVEIATRLALLAYDQLRQKNTKYAAQCIDLSTKAIALIEGDKKPEQLTDQQWRDYKTRLLAALYQATGYYLLSSNKPDEAMAKFEKSAATNPTDPFSYVLMGGVAYEHYAEVAKKYKAASPGPAQDDLLKTALATLDKVIDYYAHATALSEGNVQLKQLHDGILEELTTFYKYRHNSDEGLQQLIDKYKAPASTAPAR